MGLIIGGALLIAFALWTVIAPRQQWQLLNAWRYRDPDANEPSDLSYNMGRAAGVGTIVLVLVLGSVLIRSSHHPERDAAEAREAFFGTSSAKLTAAPPPGSTGTPVAIWRYATPSEKLLAGLGPVPDADLLIAVDGAFRPDAMTVDETPSQVTVTLRGACTKPEILCDPAKRSQALPPIQLFPLKLAAPLNGRPLIDGATKEEAIGR
ncbi:DUF6199 family natural product biosynthesis protein [Paractinoplanes lichenicola]|uniref:DUF6199 domain-containing protein n=1 Tax=Paractinoplanes lichenicola TaxID=2802976 RepID=A0ABS1VNU9_9ACTN|nr:DUF6199 family natural product biosynthesis protein [Actinoplanes lichenicola]MBL7255417.1 hypothetical protein [Actinoplanes lichenicola]